MVKQAAGRDHLGNFAPKFGRGKKELPLHDRSMITVSALITKGAFEQLPAHMKIAKKNGITKQEISEIITQLAFYVGWPNAWSAFNIVKKVWDE